MFFFFFQLADELILEKTSSPLGVLLIVFESRPDALVQVNMRMCSLSFLNLKEAILGSVVTCF